jgi:hypothetical protein
VLHGQSSARLLWEKSFDEQKQESNCGDENPVNAVLSKVASLTIMFEEINFGGDVYE